jgi:hypothetical protein
MNRRRPNYRPRQLASATLLMLMLTEFTAHATERGQSVDAARWVPIMAMSWLLWVFAAVWWAILVMFAFVELVRVLRLPGRPAPATNGRDASWTPAEWDELDRWLASGPADAPPVDPGARERAVEQRVHTAEWAAYEAGYADELIGGRRHRGTTVGLR